MTSSHLVLLAAGVLLVWLFWPRKGIPTFYLDPVIIQAGGEDS